jgi:hypothetical protein
MAAAAAAMAKMAAATTQEQQEHQQQKTLRLLLFSLHTNSSKLLCVSVYVCVNFILFLIFLLEFWTIF